jgi:hypothetical protein
MSSTSARGKLVYRSGRVLGLLHDPEDLVILDVVLGEEIGRVTGAGGAGCPEVLYDVSPLIPATLTNTALPHKCVVLTPGNRRRDSGS